MEQVRNQAKYIYATYFVVLVCQLLHYQIRSVSRENLLRTWVEIPYKLPSPVHYPSTIPLSLIVI